MKKTDLPASPNLAIPTVPAICDQCRQTGLLGEGPFSALPDILSFAPVPRRAHANGWREEHQRAFIAALALTGSPKQAARAIGRHEFGAQQLRTARGGRSFAEAWDAALDLAREREAMRIDANLAELAARREQELASASPAPGPGAGARRPGAYPPGYDPEVDGADRLDYLDAQQHVRERLLRARRLLLMLLASDPAKRAAWELLCGPVDWARAAELRAEDGEAYAMRRAREPDLLLAAEAGFLPDLTGGRDGVAELFAEAAAITAAGDGEGDGE